YVAPRPRAELPRARRLRPGLRRAQHHALPEASGMTANDEIEVRKGTVLFRQGDPSDTMFVVAAGRIRLTLGSGAEVREIGLLGPGDFFGEISLLSGAARTATAEAAEDSRLLVVGRDAFKMMV